MKVWPWVKVASNLHDNARLRLAGHHAIHVFTYLLCQNGLSGGDGIVHHRYLDPRIVALKVGGTADQAIHALDMLVEQCLIAWTPDRSINLLGWDEEWRPFPRTGAQRQRNYRERLNARYVTLRNGDDALRAVTGGDASDVRGEERREEEKREEDKRTGTSGSATPSVVAPSIKLNQARQVCSDVVAYLNEKSGRRYEVTEERVRMVKGLLTRKRTLHDLRVVVWSKCQGPDAWLGNERMDKHLCPETLLRHANFTKYLEQAKREFVEVNPDRARELGWMEVTQ